MLVLFKHFEMKFTASDTWCKTECFWIEDLEKISLTDKFVNQSLGKVNDKK